MKKITIETKDKKIEIDVEVLDNPTAKKISERLPIESRVNLWGDEIYFDAGVDAPVQNLTMDLEVGDIAYWPTGMCLCLFFGRTPASTDDKPRPASEVVVVGKFSTDLDLLRKVKPGSKIRVI